MFIIAADEGVMTIVTAYGVVLAIVGLCVLVGFIRTRGH
jgi:hypothetical protein